MELNWEDIFAPKFVITSIRWLVKSAQRNLIDDLTLKHRPTAREIGGTGGK